MAPFIHKEGIEGAHRLSGSPRGIVEIPPGGLVKQQWVA